MSPFDVLRPPSRLDPAISAYKDWLHLNVFDHESDRVGLVNVSLHGSPDDPRSRAVGSALMHDPEHGWSGNLVVRGMDEANLDLAGIGLDRLALGVDPRGHLYAAVDLADDGFELELRGTPALRPFELKQPISLGSGWISWYALPRLELEGSMEIAGQRSDLARASGYHDHNWGRWYWGEDFGWEWGAFLSPSPGPVFVLTRVTDRAHRQLGAPYLEAQVGEKRRRFRRDAVRVTFDGLLTEPLRRLPGGLAALHQDRAQMRLPARLTVEIDDHLDHFEILFEARSAAQLIIGDPVRRGYSFIHEIAGSFVATGRCGDADVTSQGLAMVEYVC